MSNVNSKVVSENERGLNIGFERCRRITGYLAVTNTWNTAKIRELNDRVIHT